MEIYAFPLLCSFPAPPAKVSASFQAQKMQISAEWIHFKTWKEKLYLAAKHSRVIGFTHKHRAQHSKNPRPTDIIAGKRNPCYLLSFIRFIAHISAELLLIHKEKIPFLPGKRCFLWGEEETCPLEKVGISSHDLEPSPADPPHPHSCILSFWWSQFPECMWEPVAAAWNNPASVLPFCCWSFNFLQPTPAGDSQFYAAFLD